MGGPFANKKSLFCIPEKVSYLNCAYMSPLSKKVLAAGHKAMYQKARPYEIGSSDFFEPVEELKKEYSKLIGVDNPHRITIIPSASYGFSTVTKNLSISAGQNIVILEEQFPSNVYCWQRLCRDKSSKIRVVSPQETNRGADWSHRILESIDSKTAVVAMGIVHWTDGTVFDLKAIRKRTLEVGAKLILDGTQAIGAFPFNLDSIKPDAMICAAYKWLMGPYSIGLAYFGAEFDQGVPLEENWINRIKSDDFQAQVGYQHEYRPFSTRYDMGEKSNFTLIPMLKTSILQIRSWGVDKIQKYCESICSEELLKLQSLGFEIQNPSHRSNHLFGIRPPRNFKFNKLRQALQKAKVFVSFRGNAIRVSPHVYNTIEDMRKLSNCLIQGLP